LNAFTVFAALWLGGCQPENTVEQAATMANRQLATYQSQVNERMSIENTYYATAESILQAGAPTARFIDLNDQLTRSSRLTVLNFVDKKMSAADFRAQLEPLFTSFNATWNTEDLARQAIFDNAESALKQNHQNLVIAQAQLQQLAAKLRTLSLPYTNAEVFGLLVGLGQQVKKDFDQQRADSTTRAQSTATKATANVSTFVSKSH